MVVGEFKVEVSESYPSSICIQHDGESIRFNHTEIMDLEYALTWAKRKARKMLGPRYEDEV